MKINLFAKDEKRQFSQLVLSNLYYVDILNYFDSWLLNAFRPEEGQLTATTFLDIVLNTFELDKPHQYAGRPISSCQAYVEFDSFSSKAHWHVDGRLMTWKNTKFHLFSKNGLKFEPTEEQIRILTKRIQEIVGESFALWDDSLLSPNFDWNIFSNFEDILYCIHCLGIDIDKNIILSFPEKINKIYSDAKITVLKKKEVGLNKIELEISYFDKSSQITLGPTDFSKYVISWDNVLYSEIRVDPTGNSIAKRQGYSCNLDPEVFREFFGRTIFFPNLYYRYINPLNEKNPI